MAGVSGAARATRAVVLVALMLGAFGLRRPVRFLVAARIAVKNDGDPEGSPSPDPNNAPTAGLGASSGDRFWV